MNTADDIAAELQSFNKQCEDAFVVLHRAAQGMNPTVAMDTFTPSRLTIARERRGMSKIDLAVAIGVAPKTITNYEAGERAPSAEMLAALANALGFPVEFFSAPAIDPVQAAGVSFRSLSSMTAGQRNSALAAATIALELSAALERRFKLPAPNLPDLRGHEPEAAAEALRAQWGIGAQSISNVVHLLEANGVRVFSLSDDCAREVDGFSFWSNRTPFVFLNPTKSGERGRFDASHELGHLVLHRHAAAKEKTAEHDADRFASAFLMPAASVVAVAPRLPSLSTIHEMKKRWKVSAAAMIRRLFDLGMLTEWTYKHLCIELSKAGGRTHEINGIERESSLLLKKVFAALRDEGPAGRSRFASELNMSVAELDSFARGLVPTAIEGGGSTLPARSPSRLRLVDG